MKTGLTVLVMLAIGAPIPCEPRTGTVCVAPNSEPPNHLIGFVGPYNPATLSVKIDQRQLLLWPRKGSVKIEGLDSAARHLVVVISDGKPVQSFRFRFSQFETTKLCMSFDGYQGVQLHDDKDSPQCKCR